MFTGIVEEIGKLRKSSKSGFWLDVSFAQELKIGQSVACNGVCLTVVESDKQGFRVDLLEETRKLSVFSELKEGSLVNVERAMKADGRFDGHIVQGHSEGVGEILGKDREDRKGRRVHKDESVTYLVRIKIPEQLMRYIILKGIIIVHGIALTVTKVDDRKSEIEVAIIPHTWENTNLHVLETGDKVNIETDVMAKYLERISGKGTYGMAVRAPEGPQALEG